MQSRNILGRISHMSSQGHGEVGGHSQVITRVRNANEYFPLCSLPCSLTKYSSLSQYNREAPAESNESSAAGQLSVSSLVTGRVGEQH